MMDSTADDGGDFPPNPFRSGPPPQQQQVEPPQVQVVQQQPPQMQQPPQQMQQQPPPLAPPQQMQQQQQTMQPANLQSGEQDFFTNPNAPDPLSIPSAPMDTKMGANVNNNNNNTMTGAPTGPTSLWQTCRMCCTMQTYQQYFDMDTVDIATRLKASITTFYLPDHFRTNVVGMERSEDKKGPDLYGPFWICMTLVFFLAVTSNIAAYLHSDDIEEFEYDISHLFRALSVLGTFMLVVPILFWVLTQCLSMQALLMVEWVCLYGYSMVPYLPASLLCLIPSSISIWICLLIATLLSVIFILRNVAGPLLATDVSQSKAGPLLLGILGTHVILLLTLKLAFYSTTKKK